MIRSLLQFHRIQEFEVTIHFVTDKKMRKIHEQFFDDPSPTDCMTFPIDPFDAEKPNLGDLFVCPFTALTYSKRHKKDPFIELSLYIVHCLLHILGYDDIESKNRKEMRMMEKKEMMRLSKADLLLKSL